MNDYLDCGAGAENTSKLKKSETKPTFKNILNTKNFTKRICSIITILVLCLAIILAMTHNKNPLKVVKNFEKAIESNDINSLKGIVFISDSDSDLILESSDFKKFINYITADSTYYEGIITSLNEQASRLVNGNDSSSYFETDYPYLNLAKSPKHNQYKILVLPIYIDISIPQKDTQVLLNGREIITTPSKDYTLKLGPLFPGNYKIEGILENDSISVTDEFLIDIINSNNTSNYFRINLMEECSNL